MVGGRWGPGGRTHQGMLFASWFSWGVGPVLPKSPSILWVSLRVQTPNHCSLSLPNSLTPDLTAPFLLTHLLWLLLSRHPWS